MPLIERYLKITSDGVIIRYIKYINILIYKFDIIHMS